MRTRKAGMEPDELRRMSQAIMEKLQRHPRFRAARTVLLFHSLPDEPCTHDLLEVWRGRKRLLLPVVCGSEIRLGLYQGKCGLSEGAFRIFEPVDAVGAADECIDLVVVPGVAFDARGHRLGRGRGYYDRFLGRLARRPYLLGICFSFQLLPEVPSEPHDVVMDEVLTN